MGAPIRRGDPLYLSAGERLIVKREAIVSSKKERDIVQVKNPRTGHYVKIDRSEGRILDHKKSEGPYQNVPVARKASKNN